MFLFLLVASPLHAQPNDNGNIDFKIDNEKLSFALFRLANMADLNFTYDAGDDLFNTKLSYVAVDKQPLAILEELLSNTGHTYKKIGNQIVIFNDGSKKSQSQAVKENTSETLVDADGPVGTIPFRENAPAMDTVFVQDTIVKILTDTVRITDTVFLEKEKSKKPATAKIKDIPVDYFNPMALRENGWSACIFIAPVVSNFSLVRQTEAITARNFSLGAEASRIFNRLNISAGFKFTQFAEKFIHTYMISDGGYFVTDTIDEYYTVTQTDTAWYYVTDSTWKPIDNHEYSYDINNRIGYLEFAASLSYDYYSNSKLRLYLKAGAQAGVLIYSKGLAVTDAGEPDGVDFADLGFNTVSYSILAGAGIKYRINEYFDFNSELYYFENLGDIVADYPFDNKIRGVGLKFGLIYYF